MIFGARQLISCQDRPLSLHPSLQGRAVALLFSPSNGGTSFRSTHFHSEASRRRWVTTLNGEDAGSNPAQQGIAGSSAGRAPKPHRHFSFASFSPHLFGEPLSFGSLLQNPRDSFPRSPVSLSRCSVEPQSLCSLGESRCRFNSGSVASCAADGPTVGREKPQGHSSFDRSSVSDEPQSLSSHQMSRVRVPSPCLRLGVAQLVERRSKPGRDVSPRSSGFVMIARADASAFSSLGANAVRLRPAMQSAAGLRTSESPPRRHSPCSGGLHESASGPRRVAVSRKPTHHRRS